jgi:hypothetical protein
MTNDPSPQHPDDAFEKWLTDAQSLLDFVENAAGMIHRLGAPPPSTDQATRADKLASLWRRCQFQVMEHGKGSPWAGRSQVLAHHLHAVPEDLFQHLHLALTGALAEVLKAAADPQLRLLSTAGLPVTFAEFERGLDEPLAVWTLVALDDLPSGHVLREAISDGWRWGLRHAPHALLGPAVRCGGLFSPLRWEAPPFVDVADVVNWTVDLRSGQRTEEIDRARREQANVDELRRGFAQTEAGRLAALEAQVAAMRTGASQPYASRGEVTQW